MNLNMKWHRLTLSEFIRLLDSNLELPSKNLDLSETKLGIVWVFDSIFPIERLKGEYNESQI